MPDTGMDSPPPGPGLEVRVSHLETDMGDVKSILGQMMPMLTRIDSTLTATLPHLATKAELQNAFNALDGKIGVVVGEIGRLDGRISEVRGELIKEIGRLDGRISEVKGEVLGEIGRLEGKIGDLRTEMHDGDSALRSEMHVEFTKINGEFGRINGEFGKINGEFGKINGEFGKLRAELAEKPSKTYLWMVLGTLIMAYAAGLAGLAVLR